MDVDFDFELYNQKRNATGKWVYIAPISGVILTAAVNFEFKIREVILVSKNKLPKIRKRLGIPIRISEMKKKETTQDFFNMADTYAVIRFSGKPDDVQIACRKKVRNELALLSLSQLVYASRRNSSILAIKGEGHVSKVSELMLETQDKRITVSGHVTGKMTSLVLDRQWLVFQREGFFLKLLKIINGKINVSTNWRGSIERAALLIGLGLNSTDLAQGFLWNVIALESLFRENNEKFSEELPKRAEAFLGWTGFWETSNYSQNITDMYNKRSKFVHEGEREQISKEDVLFSDHLVFNLMANIVQHIEKFSSKEAVVEFSKKVEAEHILGVKSKVRPRTLQFMPMRYSKEDLQER